MGAFHYRAVDRTGRRVDGTIEADNERAARARLRERGLLPCALGPVGGHCRRTLGNAALVLLTRQLSTLLNAGLPLEKALAAVIEQSEQARVRAVLDGLRGEILQGNGFASALATEPRVFSPLYRALVEAGERSGRLGAVMDRLADYLDRRARARQKVIQALAYPMAVLVVALIVVTGLMSYVVPQVVGVFVQSRQTLPWLTRALLGLSNGLREWGMAGLLAGLVALWGGGRLLARPAWRRAAERRLLRLPVIGRLLLSLNTARMAGTLAILVSSGVPLLAALATVQPLLSLCVLQDGFASAADSVREGQGLARALAATRQFPPVLIHLIGSGESSGQLAPMLERAAEQQQQEVERRLGTMSALLEPLLILLMGGLVMLIVLAIMMPIIDMNQMVR